MRSLTIDPGTLPPECDALRAQVRDFLAAELADLPAVQRARNWTAPDPAFSRKLGERGWLGMTWPRRYGGHERSLLERYVVLEELLAAGAPVGAHWIADRQSAPLLMRFAPDTLAPRIVPRIARGEAFFCIGMSEPDSGSDLASIRTRASRVGDGWRIDGRKVWTSGAHHAHYMIALVRTGERSADRHAGMSQFLIPMDTPGLVVRPIVNQLGEHDFNEVVLDDVRLPAENLIGEEGGGWHQVVTELAFERSGPERYLSSTQLLLEMIAAAGGAPSAADAAAGGIAHDAIDRHHAIEIGRVVARYATLRQMSLGVSAMLARGESPALAASVVKDQGALVEQAMPDIAHALFGDDIDPHGDFARVLHHTTLAAPSYSLRGGTREILRGIIAKGLGLR
ncbi:MAG: acyl-CoA dehydrogenase family protein [Lautropia sp.]